jgi:hypothetical protein
VKVWLLWSTSSTAASSGSSTSGFFSLQTLRNAPDTFVGVIAILVLAVALDLVWSRLRKARLAELEAP